MKWITRERPKIDRIACPWLIKRFIDPGADILYVPAADTDTLERSPQAPGLLAITLGLAANITDDQELLKTGIVIYDALYKWCQSLSGEHHGWYPDALKIEMQPHGT